MAGAVAPPAALLTLLISVTVPLAENPRLESAVSHVIVALRDLQEEPTGTRLLGP